MSMLSQKPEFQRSPLSQSSGLTMMMEMKEISESLVFNSTLLLFIYAQINIGFS
jgi:hypothetical protein